MNALEVLQEIIRRRGLESDLVTLVSHRTRPHWRSAYSNECQPFKSHDAGSASTRPEGVAVAGAQLLRMTLADLDVYRQRPDDVVSVASRVTGAAGARHLALMDLSLTEYVRLEGLREWIGRMCGDRAAWLLRSDRHYHVYGDLVLDQDEWCRWNYRFLVWASRVDRVYVSHSLLWGCNLLRLNAGRIYQTSAPVVATESDERAAGPIRRAARELAIERHRCQLRKSGEPTVNHLKESAELAEAIWTDWVAYRGPAEDDPAPDLLYAGGYLHDCIEDTESDYEDVADVVGEQVADWVRLLSMDKRRPADDRRREYEGKLIDAPFPARVIKLADLLSNLRGIRGSEGMAWIGTYLDLVEHQLSLLGPGLSRLERYREAEALVQQWRKTLHLEG
jgi:HD superfamily phosphodiesterase